MGAHGRGEVPGLRALPGIEETAPFDRELCPALELSFEHGIMARSHKCRSIGKAQLIFEPVDMAADGVSSGFNPLVPDFRPYRVIIEDHEYSSIS